MPPSPRYTVRLPHALDALVQARVEAGTPFAVLIRDALSAYLADTSADTSADSPPTAADSADTLRELQGGLAALTQRVEALERAPTARRQPAGPPSTAADRHAYTVPTGADIPPIGADTEAQPAADVDAAKAWMHAYQQEKQTLRPPEDDEAPFDPTRYRLGTLCPRQHAYQDTGQTLRLRRNGTCPQCKTIEQRERRAARTTGR